MTPTMPRARATVAALGAALAADQPERAAPHMLQRLVDEGLAWLPLPGAGETLQRWQALAIVARHDLSLAKLYEAHTDALAIMEELGVAAVDLGGPHATWGVWAAESAGARVTITRLPEGGDEVLLHGSKPWCSGAETCSHGLLTAWDDGADAPQLVSVAMRQAGLEVHGGVWQAVGMAGSSSVDVSFHGARGRLVGAPGDYLRRPGFWHGGAGIAACWYGGSLRLADTLHGAVGSAPAAGPGPFRLAALGQVDVHLQSTAALLRGTAAWIDAHPVDDARAMALRARLAAEQAATAVLAEAGRALGATPFCRDRTFARAAADLPVFLRQSHAQRDFATLGELLPPAGRPGESAWML